MDDGGPVRPDPSTAKAAGPEVDAAGATMPIARPKPTARDDRGDERRERRASASNGDAGASARADYPELLAIDASHYVIERQIATGGMGRILAAHDRRLGRPVAIKELLDDTDDARARFEREARITARLQHPGIVNILEAGTWSCGEPFYAMKLVTGEALDRQIAARQTLEGRLGLLSNVIAAVDALAYAHSMRIVHRDLKPANVLVGAFGETVVIDWGLAKDLAAPGWPDVPVGPHRPVAGGATAAGAIMGTPAYMAIEQARGEPVDERADVYALGAMLYHVLAGKPPYPDDDAAITLEAVVDGPPPPLATRVEGTPPDLMAIVGKAMARNAADRYPTARELADDLKKFQTGQLVGAHRYSNWQLARRWLRRHRAPVAITAAAVVLLTVLGVVSLTRIVREQGRTERQRQAAVTSRRDAEALLDFMLIDLRVKLESLGRLHYLDEVASRAVEYYSTLAETPTLADLARRATAHRNLADVLAGQGHADRALSEYMVSRDLLRAHLVLEPSSGEAQRGLALNHHRLGLMLAAQGDKTAALGEQRMGAALLELRRRTGSSTSLDLKYLAHIRIAIGDGLRGQGRRDDAVVEYRAAAKVLEQAAAAAPTDIDRQADLALVHATIGNALGGVDKDGALQEHRLALAIRKELVTRDPDNAQRQQDLALSHMDVGNTLDTQRRAAEAGAELLQAEAIYGALATQDPANTWWQSGLAKARMRVADHLRDGGDMVGARDRYRAALTIAQVAAARDRTNGDRQLDLAAAHTRLASVLADGDALVQHRPTPIISPVHSASDPASADQRLQVASNLTNIAGAVEPEDALAELRAAFAIYRDLARRDPANVDRQWEWAFSHDRIGDLLARRGDVEGAVAEYERERAIVAELAARDPANSFRRHMLAMVHESIGRALGRGQRAAAAYRECVALGEALVAGDYPAGPADLARCRAGAHAAER
jgi:serine/threonine protein kinase